MKNWTFYHKFQVIFKPWDVDKSFSDLSFDTAPIWIQLLGLPPRLWATKNLCIVASFVVAPLATDRMTAQRTKLEYARVLVDGHPSGLLPEEIPICGPKGIIKQKVIYEWKVLKCSNCGFFGHEKENCKRKLSVKVPVKEAAAGTSTALNETITMVNASVTVTEGVPPSANEVVKTLVPEDPLPTKVVNTSRQSNQKNIVEQPPAKQQQSKNQKKSNVANSSSKVQSKQDNFHANSGQKQDRGNLGGTSLLPPNG